MRFHPLLAGPLMLIGLPVLTGQTPLKTIQVASGLSRPLDVQAAPGDRDRIFIVEQTGRIKILKKGKLLPTAFLNLSSRVTCCSERGLLGMAFHPDYANNGYFFVNYTAGSPRGSTMIERYTVSMNPDVADPNSRKVILGPLSQPYSNHNGGCLQFGPDKYLYIGTGDGGSSGDPRCHAQNGQSLLGKMLRIDVDTVTSGYKIPPTNPFVGNAAFRDEIWALGLRNPWRFSFDSQTGDMWIGDVGQNAQEEISFQPSKSTGGENYGWKIMEGSRCYGSSGCSSPPACNATTLKRPLYSYGRTTGRSITGGYVYRGCAIPDLRGVYFFADYATRRIWSFRRVSGRVTEFKDRTSELKWSSAVSSFGVDCCGEIYICNYSTSGSVHKVVPDAPAPVIDLGYGKVGGNGKVPQFDACGLLHTGSSAEFELYAAPANSQSLLMIALASNPVPLFGGTLVTLPNFVGAVLPTGSDGTVKFTAPGGSGPQSLYAQFLILDPAASFGIGISNALRIDLQK